MFSRSKKGKSVDMSPKSPRGESVDKSMQSPTIKKSHKKQPARAEWTGSILVDSKGTPPRLTWVAVLLAAKAIVNEYDTPVTLRQLFYRLVAVQVLPNTRASYQSLSKYTAEARRAGDFPPLMDRNRSIHRRTSFNGKSEAREFLKHLYRRDRTEGQKYSIYLGIEKSGIVEQLKGWFEDLGIPVLALGGYSSQTYVDKVVKDVRDNARPAVLIYGGDYDASGQDIYRSFISLTDCWHVTRQVALTKVQVAEYGLPENLGKDGDTRKAKFIERNGEHVQVEVDSLDPKVLRSLFQAGITEFWDAEAHQASLDLESLECESLWDQTDPESTHGLGKGGGR